MILDHVEQPFIGNSVPLSLVPRLYGSNRLCMKNGWMQGIITTSWTKLSGTFISPR